eukprot:TRINITY_DN25147_c0_g1_i1.p1 TRINITY_DN25147_c0_g1~~TRINITY_DN25147_c0_g1_i1.p1  ORF type:complete len:1241 (+),score=290.42 TRINITY_DN25147_c0_g1_i1:126-3725(+)
MDGIEIDAGTPLSMLGSPVESSKREDVVSPPRRSVVSIASTGSVGSVGNPRSQTLKPPASSMSASGNRTSIGDSCKPRIHAVQIAHTGEQKEISESSAKAVPRQASKPKELAIGGLSLQVTPPVEVDDEPTPILSPGGTKAAEESRQGNFLHKPRTHSIQSLFKRAPVSRVVRHVRSRNHRNSANEQAAGAQGTEPPTSPITEGVSPSYAVVEKNVTLNTPDEKLGVQWHGVGKGSILVGTVRPNGAADRAGIKVGMRLISIDNAKILDRKDLERAIGPEGETMQKLKHGMTIPMQLEVKKGAEDPSPDEDTHSASSYDVEYNVRLLTYHPIFEATWLPCMTAVLAHTSFFQIPFVMGHLGVMWTLIILLAVATITILSLASVSALLSRKVQGASNDVDIFGPYHMLSRHVGTEYGGGVGVLYWLLLTALCALHTQGIGEAVYWYSDLASFGINETLSVCIIAWSLQLMVVALISNGVSYVSVMELFAVMMTGIAMICVVVGVSSSSAGGWAAGPPRFATLAHNWLDTGEGNELTVLEAFCRLFPSSLGILVVLGRATDMKEPEKELPKATFKAMVFCWCVLVFVILLLGSVMRVETDEGLANNTTDAKTIALAFSDIALPSPVVFQVLVLSAILVQGVQTLIIAPHVLSAIAKDHIAPVLDTFHVVVESNEQPVRALMCTAALACFLVPLRHILFTTVTIVSLIALVLVNGVAAFGALMEASNVGYRSPGFSWKVSLLGFSVCVFALFAINWYIVLTALLITLGLAKYLEMRSDYRSWGEGVKGVQLQHALEKLLSLEATREQSKNWRPQMMVFVRLDQNLSIVQPRLLSVADQLKAGKGLVIFAAVVEGDPVAKREAVLAVKKYVRSQLEDLGIAGFYRVVAAPTTLTGFTFLMQGVGLGALSPNTIMTTWPDDWRVRPGASMEFSTLLHTAHELSKAAVVIKGIRNFPDSSDFSDVTSPTLECDHIDLWWIVHDGGIELLMAFLLRQHPVWGRCELRIFTIIPAEDDTDRLAEALSKELARLKIDAILIVHPVEGEWIREFVCTQEEEALVRNDIMDQLQVTQDERAREFDAVFATHHNRTFSRTPAAVGSPMMSDSGFSRGFSNFDGFPMVELKGEPRRRSDHRGVSSVTYHFECLNELIVEHSTSTDLVLISLPDSANFHTPDEFMECMDRMLNGISRAILIRGTGEQVITGYW